MATGIEATVAAMLIIDRNICFAHHVGAGMVVAFQYWVCKVQILLWFALDLVVQWWLDFNGEAWVLVGD